MKRLILAALVVALAIALAAPVAAASGVNPKPPRWLEAESMYYNRYATDVRRSDEFHGGAAIALGNNVDRQGRIFKDMLIRRGDDLRVRIKAKGNATRNARVWLLLDNERVAVRQDFRPGTHWYVFRIPDERHGIHRVTLYTRNLGKDGATGNAPVIIDVVGPWDGNEN